MRSTIETGEVEREEVIEGKPKRQLALKDSIHKKKKEKVRKNAFYAPVLFITHYALSLSVLLSVSLVANAVHWHRITIFPPSIQEPKTRENRKKERKEGSYLTVFLHIIYASKHPFALPTEKRRNHRTRRYPHARKTQH